MPEPLLSKGHEALITGAWEQARETFESALQQLRGPDALEGLATACFFLNDGARVLEAREEAYRLHRERGDRISAARVALLLYWDYRVFRGEAAISNGWLQRAERLLEGLESTKEYGYLRYRQAQAALFTNHDPVAARAHTAVCHAIGRTEQCIDLEIGAMALDGLAYVIEGDPIAGRRCLDEAMTAIVSGESTDLTVVGTASCNLITACEYMHDYERAVQWCERLKAFCARWRIRPLMAVCRTMYAGICMARGAWQDAESELAAAASEIKRTQPAALPEVLARLGQLRHRQGRCDEAASLFSTAEPHPLAVLGHAELALDQDRPDVARELIDRYLRRIATTDRTGRMVALEMSVRAASAVKDRAAAVMAAEELRETASRLATDPVRAMSATCNGMVATLDSEWATARAAFEDAVDLFARAGMPFETARARLDRARALDAAGRDCDALDEAQKAVRIFESIGALTKAEQAAALCKRLDSNSSGPNSERVRAAGSACERLTAREREVLKLVMDGLSNPDIAERLHLSEHTIHRHISNILNKLDVTSRAAAAAAAAREGLI